MIHFVFLSARNLSTRQIFSALKSHKVNLSTSCKRLSAPIKYTQDMPPSGGYEKIQYARIPAKTYFRGITLMIGLVVTTGISCVLISFTQDLYDRLKVEERSSRLAVLPMLQAEQDRAYLKQLKKNRDDETELMKDVPGWEVGTYWGEPIYKTLGNEWLDPDNAEYNAHASESDRKWRTNFWKQL